MYVRNATIEHWYTKKYAGTFSSFKYISSPPDSWETVALYCIAKWRIMHIGEESRMHVPTYEQIRF